MSGHTGDVLAAASAAAVEGDGGAQVADGAHFDLLIVGCGPAGEKAAAQAALFGKRVCVVDPGPIGGACVHTGTLPSKSLREAALVLSGAKALDLSAVTVGVDPHVRLADLLAHKAAVCLAEQGRMERNLRHHGVTLLLGRATLTGLDSLRVQPRDDSPPIHLRGDVVLLATGTRPHRPAGLEFDHLRIWDSDEVVSMERLPSSLLVYGAGVIGCEYASIFAALGVAVTLCEPRTRPLGFLDDTIATALLDALRHKGVQLRTMCKLGPVVADDGGVSVELEGPEGRDTVRVDQLLFAAGRMGNSEGLGLAEAGLTADSRGLLRVDAQYYTGAGRIYAVGDLIGFPALASTSMDQGRGAVCHAFGFPYKQRLSSFLPYGIYTIPEVSMVGETCDALQARGQPFEIGVARYKDNARAHLQGESDGLLQLVFCPETRRLLGVHVVGHQASELVHVGLMVMQLGGTIDALVEAVFNFPTLGELYKYAAYDGLGRLARRGAAAASG